MRTALIFIAALSLGQAHAYERNIEWEDLCVTDHQPSPEATNYLIPSMLKSACAQRLYGSPKEQHLGTCMLARLTLAIDEQDVLNAIEYCRTTNGWN